MPAAPELITRFAPSPTGHLHIGGVRTALFCWAFARRNDGHFLLRIEDTDRARSSESSARGLLEDLAWLGLGWDEGPPFEPPEGGETIGGDPRGVGPFHQAERLGLYNEHIERLIEEDLAYPAFDTGEELAGKRAQSEARKETFRYRRPEDWDRDRALGRFRAGEACAIRFRAPLEPVVVRDQVLGEVRFEAGEIEDFVIRKADGFPTYHFAVVVDDHLMGVTHVLRGQEHLMNTPKHVALQEALGFGQPTYAHLPLIFNPDGSKMSKRDKDKAAKKACRELEDGTLNPADAGLSEQAYREWLGDKQRQLPTDRLRKLAELVQVDLPEIDVDDFRRSGYLPGVLLNYLALLGWNPGTKNEDGTDVERFDLEFLARHFSIERLGKKASKFDRDKLLAFNADTIQKELSPEAFAEQWRAWLSRYRPDALAALADKVELAARAVQPRTRTLSDALEPIHFVLVPDDGVAFDDKAVGKVLAKKGGEGLGVLRELEGVLRDVEPFEPEAIDLSIRQWCEARGLGMGKAAQPLRVAVTGGTSSPGLGETLALVGREGVLRRIERCVKLHGTLEQQDAGARDG